MLLLPCIFQAFKQGIYGRKYVWILPGWYSDKWWENAGETSCTKHEVKEAAGNYLATRPLPLGRAKTPTISGKVSSSALFCPAVSCSSRTLNQIRIIRSLSCYLSRFTKLRCLHINYNLTPE